MCLYPPLGLTLVGTSSPYVEANDQDDEGKDDRLSVEV